MRKAAGVIVALTLPFVVALVLLRVYFGVGPMNVSQYLNIFVEMPDFGREVVDEFHEIAEMLKEIDGIYGDYTNAYVDIATQFNSGDFFAAVGAVFRLIAELFKAVGQIWWVLVRSLYYGFVMIGMLFTEPIRVVIYFISKLASTSYESYMPSLPEIG